MRRLRPSLCLAALLLVASLAMAATPVGTYTPGRCAAMDLDQGGPVEEALTPSALVVDFTIAAATQGYVGASVGARRLTVHEAGYFAERSMAVGFLEHANGTRILDTGGYTTFGYGVQADTPAGSWRAVDMDLGGCQGSGALAPVHLAPGSYRLVVLAASETPTLMRAWLPAGATVTGTGAHAATLLSEETLACAAKARLGALGATNQVLLGCASSLSASGRAYRFLMAQWGPDPMHDVRWVHPDGTVSRCQAAGNCVERGVGGAGAWTLEVPRYVIAAGTTRTPSTGGGTGDAGIFGAFADVP